jgi:uncharacterized membrane protein
MLSCYVRWRDILIEKDDRYLMQKQDDREANPLHEYTERTGYMGSSHYYEPLAGQAFQQQTYNPPMPGYGQASYGQQSFAEAPLLNDFRFAGVLCYSFGWLTGLLFLLFGGQNRFIRFHALQSFVFFGAISIIDVGIIYFLSAVSDLEILWAYTSLVMFGCLLGLLLLNFIAFVGWIVAMVQTGHGKYFRMPFVGGLVARCVGLHSTPRW